ncbi:MAG: type II toxin-antitoxin system VapC family toxin [Propionibacteriaceae bacterium]|jgi:PIN domain nuclease of toxin-antitoxin system|nr:type II toxin-antitoxin system VapC family toxin [Propionibacteriaceae bacterium]
MSVVFDASALLAFLQEEPGASVVELALEDADAVCPATNWSEVAQKLCYHGVDWAESREALHSFGIRVEPITEVDAERAAELWTEHSSLSLADRLCLAVGERLDADVLTADRELVKAHPQAKSIRGLEVV